MNDHLIKATAFDGMIRAYAIRSTKTVEEARRRQGTWATASAALGRTITITAMMGAMLKGEDKITVKVEGGGPLGAIIVDGNAKGEVRGYVSNPHVDFELNEKGKLDVSRAVGTEGTLSVVKDLGLKENFTGQVPIVSGEISEDFTYYFAKSEQIPSAAGAGVLINPDHTVLASGGFLIQVLPGAEDETIASIENKITTIPSISNLIRDGKTPTEILDIIVGKDNMKIHQTLSVQYTCHCSKERISLGIKGLGTEEINKMIEEDHGAEATCHFCNERYTFDLEELEALKTE
ncbi:Hsp33 family molecular chaperone HslO [Aquibacillus sp. 3ASR75-11]|uniref:33 kDa chaperonin n=1 Tax=Terrihalobacillus insolitus TaxID=2950438 RepID=A0A9X4AQ41_9BACI|nr:Hsp33 family molecular chaperone HslO [Terrihalobacillus insolitus]MDC3414849.1 Hsp33 family molecular chaperone HslO [Terrihalobacillus insolitus]MDC3426248.1 Hsp33 family molecular chaperone HslO [Terrihalobacillus insolitus]